MSVIINTLPISTVIEIIDDLGAIEIPPFPSSIDLTGDYGITQTEALESEDVNALVLADKITLDVNGATIDSTNAATNLNTSVSSVNGETGVITLDTDNVDEGSSNLYYTDTRVDVNSSVVANTAKVSADGSVNSHSDVDLTSASAGEILYWTGTEVLTQDTPLPFFFFDENLSTQPTTSNNSTYLTGSVTIPETGLYEVMTYALWRSSVTNQNTRFRTLVDTTNCSNPTGDGWVEYEAKDSGNDIVCPLVMRRPVTLNAGTQTYTFAFGRGNGAGTMTMLYANITIERKG